MCSSKQNKLLIVFYAVGLLNFLSLILNISTMLKIQEVNHIIKHQNEINANTYETLPRNSTLDHNFSVIPLQKSSAQ